MTLLQLLDHAGEGVPEEASRVWGHTSTGDVGSVSRIVCTSEAVSESTTISRQ